METSSKEIVTWIMSPSQLVDYLTCPRSWWFRRVPRLPEEEDVNKWNYGHRLHEVCERYVGADSRGRDATGQPVELYPKDWHQNSISSSEQSLIQVTIEKATTGKEQVLRRMPGREVEVGYKREVIPGVEMTGKIDVLHDKGFEDHKTTKSRRWIASQKKLAKDDKMLCYAYETILQWWEKEGKLDPERTVNMRFNYFSKDPSDVFVKHVDVDVRADEVVEWWLTTVVLAAEDMLRMKKENLPAEEWSKIEGPRVDNACQAYGGCKYAQICTRMKTPERYIKQIDRINESRTKNQSQPKPTAMSVFGKTKNRKGGTVAKTDTTSSNPDKQPRQGPAKTTKDKRAEISGVLGPAPAKDKPRIHFDPNGVPPLVVLPPEPPAGSAPPWARPGCRACQGTGVRENAPCAACDKINGATGKTTSADFEIVYTDDNKLVYAGEGGSGEISLAGPTEVEEIPAKTSKEVKVAKHIEKEFDAAVEKAAKKAATNAKRAATRAANKAEDVANSKRVADRAAKEAHNDEWAKAGEAEHRAEEAKKVVSADEDGGASNLDVTPEFEFPGPTERGQVTTSIDGLQKALDGADLAAINERSVAAALDGGTELPPLSDRPPVLYINCIPIGEKVLDLAQVLQEEGKDLAEEQGKESYYDLVAYERRSHLASCAEEVVAELSGPITVQTGDADVDAYLAAVRPFFAVVVVGTR